MHDKEVENAIAIIGMSGRFPGAENIQEFWGNLCNGVDSISKFSDTELKREGVSEEILNKHNYIKSRGILKNAEFFDADFFGVSAKEAQLTDPQHRLFLECAWESLENAGYSPESYQGSIGVYGGMGLSSYFINNLYPNTELRENHGDFFLSINNEKDFLATKVSYKLNLTGPSVTIQTACSTSLAAICMACDHLLTYQCDMALAGGISIQVPQKTGYLYQEGMILSSDGCCKPFDAKANGTVMSNGAGVITLKRLHDAQKDNDHIFAIVRGYALNNDGSAKIGYSAPSVDGQAQVIASAISMAGIDPETVSYVETHGTGTILGDPVEIKGLTKAFHSKSKKTEYCAIGSVKSNIGHCSEAAGVVGLIKTILSLYNQKIPPSLHFEAPNPHIDLKQTPFYVNTTLCEWEKSDHARRACISSFGIGGTNAHLVLEEYSHMKPTPTSNSSFQLLLSAKTTSALKIMATNLGQHLKDHSELSIADVAYTLKVGRNLFKNRVILHCRNREEAISMLLSYDLDDKIFTSPIEEAFSKNQGHRIPLPTYPFERKRHWISPPNISHDISSTENQSNTIVTDLISIWKESLGKDSIDTHDQFFELGGDSLTAIQIAANISKKFNISIGLQTFLENPTIDELAKIISENQSIISPIRKLKNGDTNNLLFLIHPIEGTLFCYRHLMDALECNRTIYGIETVDTESKSIEKIASNYINEIQKIQPKGPYYLIGMSFGGILAYEMARQLKANSIALLCIIDAVKPDPALLPLSNENEMLKFMLELIDGKSIKSEPTFEIIAQKFGLDSLPTTEKQKIFDQIKRHVHALTQYKIKPYEGTILFVQAIERCFRLKHICLNTSWKKLVSGKIDLLEVEGNHVGLLKQPHVEKLAKYLNNYLK